MNPIKVRLGALATHIPYSLVPGIGGVYNHYTRQIKEYEETGYKKEWIFRKTYRIVEYAINNIPFYKDLYVKKGFTISDLCSFDDIQQIPIVSKKDLMEIPLEQRSTHHRMKYLANTGGSTGKPLQFYKTRDHQVKEMAYFHHAWSKLGFSQSDLRMQFIGGGDASLIKYDLTRNRLTANIYCPFEEILREISELRKRLPITYLQGYPSVLYEFALFLEGNPQLFELSGLKGKVKGIFFNSEYPYPEYRRKIEEVFEAKTIASYGHTEGCVVAFDYGDQVYQVEQSYGLAEAVMMDGEMHLVGTAYDNFVSPFIRYDTGDIIDSIDSKDGLLTGFRMTDGGRSGQYVTDKSGKRISLTGLIFGKHHELFNHCSQIQLSQTEPGSATVYYVADETGPDSIQAKQMFNAEGIDIDLKFERIDKPFRTKVGKVLLLVNP